MVYLLKFSLKRERERERERERIQTTKPAIHVKVHDQIIFVDEYAHLINNTKIQGVQGHPMPFTKLLL